MVEQSRLGGVLKGGRWATSEGEWGELGLWGAGVVPAVEGDWREDGFVAEVAGWCVPNWRFAWGENFNSPTPHGPHVFFRCMCQSGAFRKYVRDLRHGSSAGILLQVFDL